MDELKSGVVPESIGETEKNLLEYVDKVTTLERSLTESDLRPLRRAGFSDRAILDANLIASYFNMINRIDLGLGVELEDWYEENYVRKAMS